MEAGIAWPETHDNLTSMESWRRADVPVLPGSGPAPRLHDTASGELVLAAAGPVATLYACGITPYDATHMGHAATYTAWELSADRANAARRFLSESLPEPRRMAKVVGLADKELLLPKEPQNPRNRRISVTLLRGALMVDNKDNASGRDLLSVPEVDTKALKPPAPPP